MKEASFYRKTEKDATRCELCSHFCHIPENQTGICGARINKKGILHAITYGYPVALNVDPVEKKPIFHFQPGSLTYSLGSFGCNFSCANCQNWDLSQRKSGLEKIVEELEYKNAEKAVAEAIGNGCQSISYTYNEPTIWAEYALDIMKTAHLEGLKNIWVSNGFMSADCLDKIIPYLDAINIDLKSLQDDFYRKYCDGRLTPILENLKNIKNEGVHLEITTLVIPTLNDGEKMLKEMAGFIAKELGRETPWHLSCFSPEISWKLKDLEETAKEKIYQAYEIGKTAGLDYVYVGNLPGDQKENTYCPQCGELAIRRLGYYIERLDNEGFCAKCDKNLDIIE